MVLVPCVTREPMDGRTLDTLLVKMVDCCGALRNFGKESPARRPRTPAKPQNPQKPPFKTQSTRSGIHAMSIACCPFPLLHSRPRAFPAAYSNAGFMARMSSTLAQSNPAPVASPPASSSAAAHRPGPESGNGSTAMGPAERRLREALEKRILILDGAMGTMIQRYKLTEEQYRGERFAQHPHDVKGNNELLSLTQPKIIAEIHEQYLAAGADLIETNTFGATAVAQGDYRLAGIARDLNLASARIARAACDKFSSQARPRFVAGALGPQPKTASLSPDVNDPGARNITFDELRACLLYTSPSPRD